METGTFPLAIPTCAQNALPCSAALPRVRSTGAALPREPRKERPPGVHDRSGRCWPDRHATVRSWHPYDHLLCLIRIVYSGRQSLLVISFCRNFAEFCRVQRQSTRYVMRREYALGTLFALTERINLPLRGKDTQ